MKTEYEYPLGTYGLDRRGDYIETFTGKKFYAMDPQPEDICIEDIAHALSIVNRWTGHTKYPISVARHSHLVSLLVNPENAFEGLMHDASEAYIADIARPFKPYFTNYKEIESRIQSAIMDKFGIKSTPESAEDVGRADATSLILEAYHLLPSRGLDWPGRDALLDRAYPGIERYVSSIQLPHSDYWVDELAFKTRFKELTK